MRVEQVEYAGSTRRDGKRVYAPEHKRRVIEQCLAPGASVARVAMSHGINANLVRKWIVKHGRAMSAPSSVASPALLPVTVSMLASGEPAKADGPGSIEIELRGARVRLIGPVDAEALRSVIDALRTHR